VAVFRVPKAADFLPDSLFLFFVSSHRVACVCGMRADVAVMASS